MLRTPAVLALAFAALLAAPGSARALEAEDLLGTWYVLAHYQDSGTDHPDRERWVDRVWKFEWEGEKLKWTDYSIVVFEDETGRFERLGTNRQSRILHYWEPSPGQMDDIRDGLEVNQRGAKSKTLEPTDEGGWSSAGRASPASMNVISYVETWSIAGLAADRPVFERSDSLSSGMTETLEGVTRYTTTHIEAGELRGRYERDGTQEGTFRMIPSVGARWVKGSGKSPNQRFREMAVSQYSVADDPELAGELRATLEQSLAEGGIVLRKEDLDRLTERMAKLYQEGKSPEEIQRIVEDDMMASVISSHYDFAAKGARHDDAARYGLPFDSPAPRQLTAGVGASPNHNGKLRYSFDFRTPVGDPVVAARAGEVALVVDGYDKGGPQKSLMSQANAVIVLHEDGSFAVYVHLSPGVEVAEGDAVRAGDRLGQSGATGYTTHPQLHFAVFVLDEEGQPHTVPIRFAGDEPEGFVPVEGAYYGGPGWKAARD